MGERGCTESQQIVSTALQWFLLQALSGREREYCCSPRIVHPFLLQSSGVRPAGSWAGIAALLLPWVFC